MFTGVAFQPALGAASAPAILYSQVNSSSLVMIKTPLLWHLSFHQDMLIR